MSQLRWWLLQLIITGLIETKPLLLMHAMHVSSVWMPLVTASGCSLLLCSLWKQSVSLNKISALCNTQWSQGWILHCKRLLWQSCHYKRDIKHHRKAICSPASWGNTQHCTSDWKLCGKEMTNGNAIVHGWPRWSCDFQLQRRCGLASVGLESRPEQQQSGLGSFSHSKPTGCL